MMVENNMNNMMQMQNDPNMMMNNNMMQNDPNMMMNNNDPNMMMNNNDPNMMMNNNDPNQFMNNNNNNMLNNNNMMNNNNNMMNNNNNQNAWPQEFNGVQYWDQMSLDAAILAFNNPGAPQAGQTFNAVDGVSQFYMGGSGDDTFIAGTGKDSFTGGGGADTFVFTLGEGSSNAQLNLAAFGADGISDFNRADGDKIKIFDTDGVTALANPFSGGSPVLTSDNSGLPGFTVVKVTASNEVVFGINGNETFTDADVTVA
tara:strand:- start:51 stop:824 length:774 start_codon:yes stop_codon:yes gene_type:complete